MKKTIILSLSLLILVACATKKTTASLTDSDASRAAAKYPGASLTSLQKGKSLYEENCSKCHGLKSPTAYNEEQWGKHVKRMAPKAKIDKPTEELILQYVVTMSGK
jgi:cytochrome c5